MTFGPIGQTKRSCGPARTGDQPVLESGRGTLANADSVNQRGTARRAAVVPCMFSAPERRACGPFPVAAPDLDHVGQRRRHRDGHRIAGVDVADIDVIGFDHQPPVARGRRDIGEAERHHGPTRRNRIQVDVAVHVPQQQLRIEILDAEVADPTDAPAAERFDHRLQLPPSLGQHVVDTIAERLPFDDPGPLEPAQTLAQQRRRHPWHTPAELVEVPAAADQLAHDEQRPALVEQFHRLGDGAELVVRGAHGSRR